MHRQVALALLVAVAVVLLAPATAQAGTPPSIAWLPSSYGYGTVTAGNTDSKEFTLKNSGGSASGMLSVSLSGPAAFSITDDFCTGIALGPGKSCAVTVRYAPTTASPGDAATLIASGKKPPAGASASLSGASTLGCATNRGTGESSDNLQTIIDHAGAGGTIDIRGTCTGQFTIDKNLTLAGVADTSPTLDGQQNGTVLTVSGGAVALSQLSITNGDNADSGGGIFNQGTLTLNDSSVSGNTAVFRGGGIFNQGTMTLNGSSSVSVNRAVGDGQATGLAYAGGIWNEGTLTLNDSSSLSGNATSDYWGGGILNFFGTVTLNDSSSVSGNYARLGGGGIFNQDGTLTLNGSSSVSLNESSDGAGIYNAFFAAITTLNDSSWVRFNGLESNGGGIYNDRGTITLYDPSAVHPNFAYDCIGC